jgi:hypothetical protein
MQTPPYDALDDLAVGTDIIRQNAVQAILPLPSGHQLHLAVEDHHWVRATLLCASPLASSQTTSCLGELLHTQHVLSGGVKFGAAPEPGVLALYGDLPLQPRALLHRRWHALRHGMAQGVQACAQLCQEPSTCQRQEGQFPMPDAPCHMLSQESSPPSRRDDRLEHLQALLQEGGWHGTLQQHTVQVDLQLRAEEYRLTFLHNDDDTWQCRLHYPLPASLPAVCSQALHIFLLEGNTRVRLARFGVLMGQTPSVIAEVHLHADWLAADTLCQALDATAVAAHVLWPVLPALLTAEVARLYLHTRPATGAGADTLPLWQRPQRGSRGTHRTAKKGADLCQPL